MNIFGLYITKASTREKEQAKSASQHKKESKLWDTIVGKLLWENFNLRKALR